MIKLKRLIFKILFPHTAVILLLIPVSAVMLLYALRKKACFRCAVCSIRFVGLYDDRALCESARSL